MFHPPGVVSRFDDLAVMGDAVEHGGGHLLVAEDLGPLPEGEIGGRPGCPGDSGTRGFPSSDCSKFGFVVWLIWVNQSSMANGTARYRGRETTRSRS